MVTETKPDYYQVLSVEKTATSEEIKKAYRAIAMKYHPDRNPGDHEAADIFRAAAEAYGVIGDEESRKSYDYRSLGDPEMKSLYSQMDDIFGVDIIKPKTKVKKQASVKPKKDCPTCGGRGEIKKKINTIEGIMSTFVKCPTCQS